MANIGGLPNLGNRRLSVLQKQLNSSRKSITIVNDKLKESLDKLEKSVDKRKRSDSFRSWQKTIPVKNSLVEMKALNKCLRRRRESSTLEPEDTPRNGVYDGASLRSMRTEVSQVISEKAPTQRRLRKVEQLKTSGYKEGRLVDYHDTMTKLQTVLSRPKAQARRAPFTLAPRKTLLRQETNLLDRVYYDGDSTSPPTSSMDDPSELEDNVDGDVTQRETVSLPSARGTLQLPPIRAARRQSQYERSLPPPTCRKQAHAGQLPSLFRRVSSFGPY